MCWCDCWTPTLLLQAGHQRSRFRNPSTFSRQQPREGQFRRLPSIGHRTSPHVLTETCLLAIAFAEPIVTPSVCLGTIPSLDPQFQVRYRCPPALVDYLGRRKESSA